MPLRSRSIFTSWIFWRMGFPVMGARFFLTLGRGRRSDSGTFILLTPAWICTMPRASGAFSTVAVLWMLITW